MTVRTASDALAGAVGALSDGQWLEFIGEGEDVHHVSCVGDADMRAVDFALADYRAATTKAKRAPVVHLSTGAWGRRARTGCFGASFWVWIGFTTLDPAAVTCKGCRRSRAWKALEEVEF